MIVNPASMVRKLVSFPHALVAAIEDFRFANRIRTESEAIRRLVELGLQQEDTLQALLDFFLKTGDSAAAEIIVMGAWDMANPEEAARLRRVRHLGPPPLKLPRLK